MRKNLEKLRKERGVTQEDLIHKCESESLQPDDVSAGRFDGGFCFNEGKYGHCSIISSSLSVYSVLCDLLAFSVGKRAVKCFPCQNGRVFFW